MAGPLTGVNPAARALSRQRGRAQHPFLGAGAGLSCMAGPLTGEMAAARTMSRQRGLAQHPFLGAGATVQGTQLHGWSPRWCDAQHPCMGALSRRRYPGILGAVNHDLPCPGSVCRECVHGWAWVGSWLEMMPWHWSTKRQH
jgi:hypothetical protein